MSGNPAPRENGFCHGGLDHDEHFQQRQSGNRQFAHFVSLLLKPESVYRSRLEARNYTANSITAEAASPYRIARHIAERHWRAGLGRRTASANGHYADLARRSAASWSYASSL
jgi:hypothetical protein